MASGEPLALLPFWWSGVRDDHRSIIATAPLELQRSRLAGRREPQADVCTRMSGGECSRRNLQGDVERLLEIEDGIGVCRHSRRSGGGDEQRPTKGVAEALLTLSVEEVTARPGAATPVEQGVAELVSDPEADAMATEILLTTRVFCTPPASGWGRIDDDLEPVVLYGSEERLQTSRRGTQGLVVDGHASCVTQWTQIEQRLIRAVWSEYGSAHARGHEFRAVRTRDPGEWGGGPAGAARGA
jgi:hypothetical protein